MSGISLKALINKSTPALRDALEQAAVCAHRLTHHEVDVEHLLQALLQDRSASFRQLLQHFAIRDDRLQDELARNLEKLRGGNTRNPVLSARLIVWLRTAWLHASLENDHSLIGDAHLLRALFSDAQLRSIPDQECPSLQALTAAQLDEYLRQQPRSEASSPQTAAPHSAAADLRTPALDLYAPDLTARASAGEIDPVLGRDREIRQMIDILMRRRQNNPILTGEAGVGKTAVVEGLALRIAAGDVPDVMRNVRLRTLDLGLLQAGASVKGEFENRLRQVIDEVRAAAQPIILFIDEAHTLIGAGGNAGQNDAANLLKPALARGELRTIAATTWAEYKKYFEKDAALARRFQRVAVDEPSEAQAVDMLRAVAAKMAQHHGIRILDQAVIDAVRLSTRFLTDRQLPDKAISVLDTACARVALSRSARPAMLEDNQVLIDNIRREMQVLEQEHPNRSKHAERLARLHSRLDALLADQAQLQAAQQKQKQLVSRLDDLRTQLAQLQKQNEAQSKPRRGRPSNAPDLLIAHLESTEIELRKLHQEFPLIHDCVDNLSVAEVIAGWTGIPLGKMMHDELATVRRLPELLKARIIGQDHAIDSIARRIQIARASMEDPGKPKGVFLLVGPSGVGKTETAHALADTLYGGSRNLITINLSEYQEAHSVAGLKGSPPGYVGYGEGGVLTEAVRRRPHSVLLLDEVEKAHPDVLELFYQVFDKGLLEDAEGRQVDFRNTVILLTSNAGSALIQRAVAHGVQDDDQGPVHTPGPEDLLGLLKDELHQRFKPAFLGRLSIIPYLPLSQETIRAIVAQKLQQLRLRARDHHNAEMTYAPQLVDVIAQRCSEVETGARDADRILSDEVLSGTSAGILNRLADGLPVRRIHIDVHGEDQLNFEVA